MEVHDPTQLGKLVRENRRAKGLKQADLALSAGTGRRFIVDLERGKPTAQLDQVMRVLHALGLVIDLRPPERSSAWLRLR